MKKIHPFEPDIDFKEKECPFCSGTDLDCKRNKIVDDYLYIIIDCENCGESFKKWYSLKYIGMTR